MRVRRLSLSSSKPNDNIIYIVGRSHLFQAQPVQAFIFGPSLVSETVSQDYFHSDQLHLLLPVSHAVSSISSSLRNVFILVVFFIVDSCGKTYICLKRHRLENILSFCPITKTYAYFPFVKLHSVKVKGASGNIRKPNSFSSPDFIIHLHLPKL